MGRVAAKIPKGALDPPPPPPPTELVPPREGEKSYAPATRAGRLEHAQRRAMVLRLRRTGATIGEISAAMTAQGESVTPRQVERMLSKALAELQQSALNDVEMVRTQQLDRIDAMIRRLWPMVMDGNLKAIDRVTNLERLRAKLAGTEAPQRVEHGGTVDHRVSQSEVADLQRLWLESGGYDGTADEIADAEVVG